MDVADNSVSGYSHGEQYQSDDSREQVEEDEFFYPLNLNSDISIDQQSERQRNYPTSNANYFSMNIRRFMDVVELREQRPLSVEID